MQLSKNVNFINFILHRHSDVIVEYGVISLVVTSLIALVGMFLRQYQRSRSREDSNPRCMNVTNRLREIGLVISMLGILVGLHWWFNNYSIWRREWLFAAEGYPSLYTLMRIIHGVWLGVLATASGLLILRPFSRRSLHLEVGVLPALIVAALSGVAAIRLSLFPLGLVGQLRLEALIPFIAVVFWFSRGDFLALVLALFHKASRFAVSLNRSQFVLGVILVSVVAMALFAVGLLNVLYVNNDDGDYITHYGPYYDLVIANHSALPNDVWYQYFYSKGEGFGFASMILSDRLGKQLSAYICFIFALLAIFDLMQKEFKSLLWAMAGVTVVISIFGIDDSGGFEKHHVATAAIMVAIAYSAYHLFNPDTGAFKIWRASGTISIMSLVVLSLPAVAYAWIVLGGLGLVALFERRWHVASGIAIWFASSGVFIVIVLAINYIVAGLPEITPFNAWLNWLDTQKFATLVSPHLIDYLVQGSSGFEKGSLLAQLKGALSALRLDKIASRVVWGQSVFFVSAGITVFLAVIRRKKPREFGLLSLISALFSVSVIIGYLAVGQPVSVYRASVFSAFFITPLVFSVLIFLTREFIKPAVLPVVAIVIVTIIDVKAIIGANAINPQRIDARLSFLIGKKSLADAFAIEFGVPSQLYDLRYKYGENNKWLYLRATNEAGLAHFIGRGIETEVSYSLGPNWHIIAYGEADQAKAELIRRGINYILVQVDEPTFGNLPFSNLFKPQTIIQYMRVVERLGSFVLLTWREQDEAIDPATELFAMEWAKTLAVAPFRDLYDRSRFIYLMKSTDGLAATNIRQLSPIKGWQ